MMVGSLLVGLVGLALGSFLNVVITRLPRGEAIWAGRSRCLQCRRPLAWYDNIPLLSYIWLRGRCRACGAAISWRYPLVELAGGLMAVALWRSFPFPDRLLLLAYGPFCLVLIVLAAIDLEHRLLPDAITIPGTILGLLLSLVLPHLSLASAAAGALGGGALFYVVGRVYEKLAGRRGLGGGDVKLMAMIGAFLGVGALPLVILISAGLGTLIGLIQVLLKSPGARTQWRTISLPYGPFLAAGAWCYLFGGQRLLSLLSGGG
jgi:leader peptidase (prepilin peptidase)/N-methyltransferase